jgi:nicotinamide riboside transporter PnuC
MPWFGLGFSFFCMKEITHCEVLNAVYCCTYIWQLKYMSYVNVALFVWLLMTLQGYTWDRIQKKGKMKDEFIFHTLCRYRDCSLLH